MPFGNKVVLRSVVHFYGVAQFEANEDSSMHATVELPGPDERPGETAFLPLITSRLLYNSRAEPLITTPLLWLLREAANETLASESSAREFSFRNPSWQDDTSTYDEIEELLVTSMPALAAGDGQRPDQSFRAELMQGRNGMLWAKIHAPRRGPAFFAAFGLFAMLEQTARTAPYQHVVAAMAGVLTLTDLYFDVLDQENWDSLAAMTTFQEAVTRTALADDPLSHLTAARKDAGIHGISGPDPWVARTDS